MLITKTHYDIPSKLNDGKPIRIFVIAPVVPNYPQAEFPGIHSSCTSQSLTGHHGQALSASGMRWITQGLSRLISCISEIYQVTGPVERFAGQIASHGYVVGESGSSHDRVLSRTRVQRARRHITSSRAPNLFHMIQKVPNFSPPPRTLTECATRDRPREQIQGGYHIACRPSC